MKQIKEFGIQTGILDHHHHLLECNINIEVFVSNIFQKKNVRDLFDYVPSFSKNDSAEYHEHDSQYNPNNLQDEALVEPFIYRNDEKRK